MSNTSATPPSTSKDSQQSTAAVLEQPPGAPKLARVGNLTYTTMGLLSLFAWLLLFDFCFSIMESELGPIIQFRLMNNLKMNAWWYATVLTTIPAFINFFLNPIISIRSDRFRSRFGRRIPFLLVGAPPTCACLALIGFAPDIGGWLHAHFGSSPNSAVIFEIWTFSVLMLMFTVFNMFLGTTFYYLFNDVVPREHMVKFMGYFRATGVVAGMIYQRWIFPYSDKEGPLHLDLGFFSWHTEHIWYPKLILVGGAILYLGGATIALLKVKEPDYPPPPPLAKGDGVLAKIGSTVKTIVNECFSHRFYVLFFMASVVEYAGYSMGIFMQPARKAMGMDFFALGRWASYIAPISLVLVIATASWGDRWRPLPLFVATGVMTALKGAIQLLFLIPGLSSETYLNIQLVFNVAGLPLGVLAGMAATPLHMSILPKDRYGQFAAANSMIRTLFGSIIGGQIASLLMAWLITHYERDYALRFSFLWAYVFNAGALFCYYLLYREWKRLGGRDSFQPPAVRPAPSDPSIQNPES